MGAKRVGKEERTEGRTIKLVLLGEDEKPFAMRRGEVERGEEMTAGGEHAIR
jgi:hypothetical protein